MSFLNDLKFAVRSLSRQRALWFTVALTLALGIGANAAIFSVVRAVLLRPLVNRDEDRLLYLRQSAPGIGEENATFSVPEIMDIGSNLKTIQELGTFSELDFTVIGDTVNTAARVESATRDTGDDLLITHATRSLINDDDAWIERPAVQLKGKSQPVRVYASCTSRSDREGTLG